MSIAIQAIVIFALVLPGILIRRGYHIGMSERPVAAVPVTEEIAYSLLFACAFHALYGGVVHRLVHPIDLDSAARLLLGNFGDRSALLETSIRSITRHPYLVFSYFASSSVLALAAGGAMAWSVRTLRLDVRFALFRVDRWRYFFREFQPRPESEVVPILSCLVDTKAATFLYVGVLHHVILRTDGDVDLLVLHGSARRPIGGDDASTARPDYYFIDADYLFLKYTEIKNLSVKFVSTELRES